MQEELNAIKTTWIVISEFALVMHNLEACVSVHTGILYSLLSPIDMANIVLTSY